MISPDRISRRFPLPGFVRSRFVRSPFAARVAAVAMGGVIAQLIVICAAPILTRLYSAADFGVLAIYASLLTTVNSISSLRYEIAIPLAADDKEAMRLASVALIVLSIVTVFVGVGMRLGAASIERIASIGNVGPMTFFLPLSVFAVGGFQILLYWRIRQDQYGAIGTARIAQGAGQVAGQIAFGALGLGAVGLIAGDLVGRSFSVGPAYSKRPRLKVDLAHLVDASRTARRWIRFPVLSSPSAFFNSAGRHLTPFLMAAAFGPAAAGWLALTQRVAMIPHTTIGDAASQVFYGEVTSRSRNRADLMSAFRGTMRRLALIGIPLFVVAAVVAPVLFSFVFGTRWRQAGLFLSLLAPMFVAMFIVVPVTPILPATGRLDLALGWDVARFIAVASVFVLAHTVHWHVDQTVGALSLCMVGMYAVLAMLCRYAITHQRSPGSRSSEELDVNETRALL